MRKAREVAEKGWEPNGAVVHVIDDTWPAFRQANPKAVCSTSHIFFLLTLVSLLSSRW
jgi:hypothetical protein